MNKINYNQHKLVEGLKNIVNSYLKSNSPGK